MKAVNVDEVLKILHKYGKYIFVTDEKRYTSMVDEIANLKALRQESCEDCISRQAVLDTIDSYMAHHMGFLDLKLYITELSSVQPEQFINKPCVSEQACREDKVKVLEKIRAEIEEYKSRQLPLGVGIADLEEGKQIALEYVLAVLDKYMAESEKV